MGLRQSTAVQDISQAEKAKTVPVEPDRGQWGSPIEFILSCLGYAVGLGNVWRFPSLVYANGGGAFLIPYVIMLTFVGLPVFFIELTIGQYSGRGPMDIWAISPIFQGIGAGMVVISFISSIYYNMLMGWSIYYLFASWQKTLPWSTCSHDYNTAACYTKREATACESWNGTWYNQTCYNDTSEVPVFRRISASEEYFNIKVLDQSSTMEDYGYMKWDLVLVLLAAWVLCCLCVIKGIKSSGKVVYFTAIFPYVVLIVLLIRGVLLPGARTGIEYYVIPDWSKLSSPKVWGDAAGQVFFSLSVGMGGLMTFASYNSFHNNIYRDTFIVVILDAVTSIVAGFAIFSILGHLAHILDTDVSKVVQSGAGLAFIAYPEVVTYLEPPQLWATLFFLMLITLGIDSQFAGIETVMTAIVDRFPTLRTKKVLVSSTICAVMFLLGLSMCTRAGVYWLELMSYYSSGWSLVIIALAESIVFSWIYGAKRLMKDVEVMVGFRLHMHWWFCWVFIVPTLLTAILVFNFVDFTPDAYGDYVLPTWAQVLGWFMATVSIALIPVCAVYQIWNSYRLPDYAGYSFLMRLWKLTQATDQWKPSNEKTVSKNTDDAGDEKIRSPSDVDSTPTSEMNGRTNTSFEDDSGSENVDSASSGVTTS